MEDYKKKYEDLITSLKKAKNDEMVCDDRFCVVIDDIVPELKESEDEKIRKELISFITDRKNWFPKEETKASWIAWLEKKGEQKPAEWSGEDETMLKDCIGAVSTADYYPYEDKQKTENWLKSHKPNHWKPSEQEKVALRTVIHIMTEERNFPKLGAQLQNILDVFEGKSRKEWKPSDGQMQALELVVQYHAFANQDIREKIVALFNDLKKLKG